MSDPLHEKIQLAAADIRYLQKVFLDNAHNKLNVNLPSSSQDTEDLLTLKIVELIESFVYEIFEMSRHSLVIDGQDMGGVDSMKSVLSQPREQTEPFDVEINLRLRQLYQEVEKETLEVTKLRREVPLQLQSEFAQLVEDDDIELDSKSDLSQPEIRQQDVIPRLEEMIDDYNDALTKLHTLKENIPAQSSEVDKLSEIADFLLRGRK